VKILWFIIIKSADVIYEWSLSLGHDETFQFIAEKVDKVNPCRSIPENEKDGVTDHVTPLYIANQKKHLRIVQIIEDKLQNANKKRKYDSNGVD